MVAHPRRPVLGYLARLRAPAPESALVAALGVLLALATPGATATQEPDGKAVGSTTHAAGDSAGVRAAAEDAQERFERLRYRRFPVVASGSASECDEIVGRFCVWYDEGEWYPRPEDPEVSVLRAELLHALDTLQRLSPDDGWIVGQRVWYRLQAGDTTGALKAADGCVHEAWWCVALGGFVLHETGRFRAAEEAFARALGAMEPERARVWRRPYEALDPDARRMLRALEHPDSASAEARLLGALWSLSDPLYLVDGNDRLTAHYARWVVTRIREGARNPFRLRWGDDLEEMTVRHGWEVGWERRPTRDPTVAGAVGHQHPDSRDFLPDGRTLADPSVAGAEAFHADRRRPSSLHAPTYAPVLLPMDAQLTVFPRADRLAVVATYALPPDTTHHARHTHPRPWMEPGAQEGLPVRAGLFLRSTVDGSEMRALETGSEAGVLMLEVPAGRYVASTEVWDPHARRAGRDRRGIASDTVPPDVPTLSQLLLVSPGVAPPTTLQEAAVRALRSEAVELEGGFGLVWEVTAPGLPGQRFAYRLAVAREGGSLLRAAGRWLGVVDDARVLFLQWEEPAPAVRGTVLRHLDLASEAWEPGRYTVRLELTLPGRSTLVSERSVELRR